MLSLMGICLKKFIWTCLLVMLVRGSTLTTRASCFVNYTSPFMVLNKLRDSGTLNSLIHFFSLASFTKGSGPSFVALLVYVDDIIINGPFISTINCLKSLLQGQFKLKDLGHLKYFLGLEIARFPTGIVLSQRHYTFQLLEDTGFHASKPTSVPMDPMDPKSQLHATDGELLPDAPQYRRFIGSLVSHFVSARYYP